MEKNNGNNGLAFDDPERSIGDIPYVASENVHVEGSMLRSLPSMAISANFFEPSSVEKLQSNENLMATNNFSVQNSHVDHRALMMGHSMPGNQSCTFAFEKLSLGDEVKDQALLQSDDLNKQLFNLNTPMLSASDSSNYLTGGIQDHHTTRLASQNSTTYRAVSEEYNKWQVGFPQPFETSFPAMLLGYDMANVPAQNSQFPIPSDQQVFPNGRTLLPYIQPQQIANRQISLNPMEDGQFYRIQGQYTHLQDLYNRPMESLLPLQSCENLMNKKSCQLLKQQCFEVPTSNHLVQSNHGPLPKTRAFRRGLNHVNTAFPPVYMNATQGMEGIWRSSSGRSLSMSHGVNTADAIESWSVDEANGKIYLLAKDQHGCRFLQQKFVEGTPEDLKFLFNEIIDHVVELMTDPFGNCLMLKLIEVCDEDQRLEILHRITRKRGELVRISCNTHGTRVIQKVIETLRTPEQIFVMVSALKAGGAVTLMNNVNGNHVAQHCLRFLIPYYCEFLYDAARNYCVELATDRHGCCVLQRCISCSNDIQQHRMIMKIIQNVLVISQDQYGNYVVQFILKLQISWATANIIRQLQGNFGDLSLQKYSSNVVEKCIIHGEKEHVTNLVDELINDPQFDKIMQDPYGNYIIQTAFRQTEGFQQAKLVNAIRLHVPALRISPYGKRVLALIRKSNQINSGSRFASLITSSR